VTTDELEDRVVELEDAVSVLMATLQSAQSLIDRILEHQEHSIASFTSQLTTIVEQGEHIETQLATLHNAVTVLRARVTDATT